MKWLNELCGIPVNSMLNISVPKEKLVANIRTKFVQMAAVRELDYIEDIVYHAIFRDVVERQTIGELHIIEVKLREPKYVKIIAEAFQQAIPYSQIIVFSSGEKYLLFESYAYADKVKQFQFSEWVYAEEMVIDYSLGSRKQADSPIVANNRETWKNLPEKMSNLFRAPSYSGYLCLRHLIDILRIKEIEHGKELIRPIVSRLIEYGKVEFFDDMPFVTWSDADSLYGRAFPYKCSPSIADERFGIDRQFEPLAKNDFTSYEEALYLLEELESSVSYLEFDPDNYVDPEERYADADDEYYGDVDFYDDYD